MVTSEGWFIPGLPASCFTGYSKYQPSYWWALRGQGAQILTLTVPHGFNQISPVIWIIKTVWSGKFIKNIIHSFFEYIMNNFVLIAVPANGLAPLGARPFAGTVMTDFKFCKCRKPTLWKLNIGKKNADLWWFDIVFYWRNTLEFCIEISLKFDLLCLDE